MSCAISGAFGPTSPRNPTPDLTIQEAKNDIWRLESARGINGRGENLNFGQSAELCKRAWAKLEQRETGYRRENIWHVHWVIRSHLQQVARFKTFRQVCCKWMLLVMELLEHFCQWWVFLAQNNFTCCNRTRFNWRHSVREGVKPSH